MAKDALLLNFREQNSLLGVRRDTLKAVAEKLGVSETKAVHIAIGRLHSELFGDNREYDYPSEKEIAGMNRSEEIKGRVVSRQSLFDLL